MSKHSAEYQTEQEQFWAGSFGDEYSSRNAGKSLLAGNLHLFSRIIERTVGVHSVTEFGCNRGMNLVALAYLLPEVKLRGVEINQTAIQQLSKQFSEAELAQPEVIQGSFLDVTLKEKSELVFSKGVLIHIAPERLKEAYGKLFETSTRYVMVAEYYNPTPTEIPYRGHSGKLFKRDFAGELMDAYPQLSLIDYGFSYHRDPCFPQDDITWFLFQKEA